MELKREIIRVFPYRTDWTPVDDLAFTGPPPMPQFLPGTRSTPVHVSVTFTWDRQHAEGLAKQWAAHYSDVQIGGVAYRTFADEFTPGLYLKEGCTITSRGCPKACGWCAVPVTEGKIRLLKIQPGWIVQDNNLLACPEEHTRDVFDMLRDQKRRIFFNGGLDKHFLKDWHVDLFRSVAIGELWFACDVLSDLLQLEKCAKMLDGIPLRKRRCYTMIGYDGEAVEDAEFRLNRVLELGFMPFCQLYQNDTPKNYPENWKKLRRKWSRPAAYMGPPKHIDEPLFQSQALRANKREVHS